MTIFVTVFVVLFGIDILFDSVVTKTTHALGRHMNTIITNELRNRYNRVPIEEIRIGTVIEQPPIVDEDVINEQNVNNSNTDLKVKPYVRTHIVV